ncbi:MAG: M20/M25/M40 family metallo-hydrolase, partial [Acetobacteraceae bacterium]|nr:M20/M25/M40 family metallo-hydrolase [Acetobacteraceae bacterium]
MSAPQAIEAAAEARRDASITFLRELIALQPKGEAEVQAHVADALRGLGCVVDSLRYAPTEVPMRHEFAAAAAMDKEERASIIARLQGSGGGRSLIFFAHPDGEPITGLERWKHDPFAGEIEAGRLYGWGVSDDLSGVAIMVEALQALKEAGLRPAGDVLVTSTPSKRHARGVAAALHHGYGADAAVYVHPAESGQGMQEVKAICSGQLYF